MDTAIPTMPCSPWQLNNGTDTLAQQQQYLTVLYTEY